jgi:uncharacterized membrane protein YdjX (TVP38/TMEM64 family)
MPGRGVATVGRLAVVLGLVVVVLALGRALDGPALLREALDRVRDLGPWGPAIFVVVYVLATVLLLPAVVLTLGAGALFGIVTGAVAVSIGATLGATAAFLVARYLARERVARRLEGYPALRAIDAAVAREGWKIVGLTRLSPAFPFILLNYAYGLSRVSLRDYVLASWIGMLPGIVTYVYLGSLAGNLATLGAAERARTPAEWALSVAGLLATAGVTLHITRLARSALRGRIETSRA